MLRPCALRDRVAVLLSALLAGGLWPFGLCSMAYGTGSGPALLQVDILHLLSRGHSPRTVIHLPHCVCLRISMCIALYMSTGSCLGAQRYELDAHGHTYILVHMTVLLYRFVMPEVLRQTHASLMARVVHHNCEGNSPLCMSMRVHMFLGMSCACPWKYVHGCAWPNEGFNGHMGMRTDACKQQALSSLLQ